MTVLRPLLPVLLCGALAACGADEHVNTGAHVFAAALGGDATRGRAAIGRYGCGACHTIDGVRGARGLVGPPLTGLVHRSYIAGVLTNEPENLVRWIRNPKEVDPLTAMPFLGVTEQDARDIATFLYTRQ